MPFADILAIVAVAFTLAGFFKGVMGFGFPIVFALSRLLKVSISVPRKWERSLSVPLGAINGMLTGMTGSFMVPSVLFMQAMGFQRDMLVQAMGIFFAISTIVLPASLGRHDLISMEHVRVSVSALMPSLLGLTIGRRVRLKIDEERFQQLFLVSVLLLGGYISINPS